MLTLTLNLVLLGVNAAAACVLTKVFEDFIVDSQYDAALSDDLGDAHRAEARTRRSRRF